LIVSRPAAVSTCHRCAALPCHSLYHRFYLPQQRDAVFRSIISLRLAALQLQIIAQFTGNDRVPCRRPARHNCVKYSCKVNVLMSAQCIIILWIRTRSSYT